MIFQELNLIEPLLRALKDEGYDTPTPIQQQSIPHALTGRDLLACAQTGTGKTAAFALPILQRLHEKNAGQPSKNIKSLILTPTRELAIQIGESFTAYGRHLPLRNMVVFGGVSQKPQEDDLRRGVDILVATPGRLLDLMNQGLISLQQLEVFVLDEADRMLDMGFIHDVRRVIKALPERRQTLFFSATMPPEIAKLAHDILSDPLKVAVTPISSTVELIDQHIFFVDKNRKKNLLLHLLESPDITSALVFTRTKHGANRVAQDLSKAGVHAQAIHGNKSQTARQNALSNFKTGDIRVLVATDIAARGIDLEELSHVINFDLPNIPETYVHRIGRTGRAGASGVAFSFCDEEEKAYLRDIQRLIDKKIPVVNEHPFPLGSGANDKPEADDRPPRPQRGNQPRNQPRREPQRGEQQPRRNEPRREQLQSGEPQVDKQRPQAAQGNGRPETGNGEARALSSRRRGRGGRNRGGRNAGTGENRPAQSDPQRGNQRPQPQKENQPKPPQGGTQPEKQEASSEDKPKWSSIFKEPNTGKKGFVIKSDRDDNKPKKRFDGDRRGPRGGKR